MTPLTRDAIISDAAGMCAVLNPLIRSKTGTALRQELAPDEMVAKFITRETLICCTVAEIDDKIAGFQSLYFPDASPSHAHYPKDWGIIATFVDPSFARRGVGQALFAATRKKAIAAGVPTLDASIDQKNANGLKFYSSLGFRDYLIREGLEYSTGGTYTQVCKRFDLKGK